jgi:primosomal protein N'
MQVPSASSSLIHQSQNGHFWCQTCHIKMPLPVTCPVCREKYVGGRCLIVEKLLEGNFEKKYKDEIKELQEKTKEV